MEANSTETDHTRSSNWISLSCRQRIPDRLVYSRIRRPPRLLRMCPLVPPRPPAPRQRAVRPPTKPSPPGLTDAGEGAAVTSRPYQGCEVNLCPACDGVSGPSQKAHATEYPGYGSSGAGCGPSRYAGSAAGPTSTRSGTALQPQSNPAHNPLQYALRDVARGHNGLVDKIRHCRARWPAARGQSLAGFAYSWRDHQLLPLYRRINQSCSIRVASIRRTDISMSTSRHQQTGSGWSYIAQRLLEIDVDHLHVHGMSLMIETATARLISYLDCTESCMQTLRGPSTSSSRARLAAPVRAKPASRRRT